MGPFANFILKIGHAIFLPFLWTVRGIMSIFRWAIYAFKWVFYLFWKKPKMPQMELDENGKEVPTKEFLEEKRKEYTCPLTHKIPAYPTQAYCCKKYF
jgi:hypothetical protein